MSDLLGRFLRDRRARVTAAQAGLPSRRPGRSQTLTQEDLARLTGYSVRTISALEQGAGHRPTRHLLDAITAALHLDADERRTLWQLAVDTAPPESVQTAGDANLNRLVALQDPNPAYVCDAAYNVLAHNDAFAAWIWDFTAEPPERRNLAVWLFTHPHRDHILPRWEQEAGDLVARIRTVHTRLSHDPSVSALIERLRAESPEFRGRWDADSNVAGYPISTTITFRPPGAAPVTATMVTLTPLTADDNRRFSVFLLPDDHPAVPRDAECAACGQLSRD